MNPEQRLAEALSSAGLDQRAVVLAPPPEPESPPPPEGRWLIVPYGSQFVVGAVARAKFAPYGALWSFDDAVSLATRLASTAAASRDVGPTASLRATGEVTARRIRQRTEQRGGSPGPTQVVGGEVFDAVEPETAHHLYAWGTPFSQRSQPPDAIGGSYHQYEVLRDLPGNVQEGRAAPWFGQPGGGSMLVLDRPIRWYVDQGLLVELVETEPAHRPR